MLCSCKLHFMHATVAFHSFTMVTWQESSSNAIILAHVSFIDLDKIDACTLHVQLQVQIWLIAGHVITNNNIIHMCRCVWYTDHLVCCDADADNGYHTLCCGCVICSLLIPVPSCFQLPYERWNYYMLPFSFHTVNWLSAFCILCTVYLCHRGSSNDRVLRRLNLCRRQFMTTSFLLHLMQVEKIYKR